MNNLKRINLNLNSEVLDRIDKDADEMGITRTALINMMINQYYKGNDAIAVLTELAPILKQYGGDTNGNKKE